MKKYFEILLISENSKWEDVEKIYGVFNKIDEKSLVCCEQVEEHPYLCFHEKDDNKAELIVDHKFYRRQDVPDVYDVTTLIYVANKKYINKCKKIIEGNVGYIIVPKERSLDIDDKHDLKIARLLLKK